MDSSKFQDPSAIISSNKKAPLSKGGHSKQFGFMCNLKDDIIPPKFYALLINKELKGYTALDLENLYNNVNMCVNAMTRLREDLLNVYHSIKSHSEFEE